MKKDIKRLYSCNKCTFHAKLRPALKMKIQLSHQKAWKKDASHVLGEKK